MSDFTKLDLIDNCIDGDREKFNALFGDMYDQFNCFYNILKENGINELPCGVTFEKRIDVAEFQLSAKISLDSTEQTTGVFNCKIAIKPSKQTTKVSIQSRV